MPHHSCTAYRITECRAAATSRLPSCAPIDLNPGQRSVHHGRPCAAASALPSNGARPLSKRERNKKASVLGPQVLPPRIGVPRRIRPGVRDPRQEFPHLFANSVSRRLAMPRSTRPRTRSHPGSDMRPHSRPNDQLAMGFSAIDTVLVVHHPFWITGTHECKARPGASLRARHCRPREASDQRRGAAADLRSIPLRLLRQFRSQRAQIEILHNISYDIASNGRQDRTCDPGNVPRKELGSHPSAPRKRIGSSSSLVTSPPKGHRDF